MEYVNLEEYKDRPELIQHENGTNVVFIYPVPGEEETSCHFTVLFENGNSCTYGKDGRYLEKSLTSSFVLKSKQKSKVIYMKNLKQIIEEFPDSYFRTNGDLVLDGRYVIDRPKLCLIGRELPLESTARWPRILLEEREE